MTTQAGQEGTVAGSMRAVRLHAPGEIDDLVIEEIATPAPAPGEVLVRVRAAAITKDELTWPVDRLPAITCYEFSGTVAAVAAEGTTPAVGSPVFALSSFERDGAAADYIAVPATVLAAKPEGLDHVSTAALPLAGLSAWQGLFDHGRLEEGQRVLILGAAGGVGHLATQLARWKGAHVIGTASSAEGAEAARGFGADEVLDPGSLLEGSVAPVDLVFDTVGGASLQDAPAVIAEGGRLVTVAEDPPEIAPDRTIEASYFLVDADREQLETLARLVDAGDLRVAIDSVFPIDDAAAAFSRSMAKGKRGKVVLRIAEEDVR
jgi:NADPH:quinone reductase-like Zn-dependent oxidoreductase